MRNGSMNREGLQLVGRTKTVASASVNQRGSSEVIPNGRLTNYNPLSGVRVNFGFGNSQPVQYRILDKKKTMFSLIVMGTRDNQYVAGGHSSFLYNADVTFI
jgi:hypothetical protein